MHGSCLLQCRNRRWKEMTGCEPERSTLHSRNWDTNRTINQQPTVVRPLLQAGAGFIMHSRCLLQRQTGVITRTKLSALNSQTQFARDSIRRLNSQSLLKLHIGRASWPRSDSQAIRSTFCCPGSERTAIRRVFRPRFQFACES